MTLNGKVAIVTGAAQGLGQAYAIAMAEAGAAITALDLTDCAETVAAVEAKGGKCIGRSVDITDMDALTTVAAETKETFGGVDVLVNNAALYGTLTGGRFNDLDPAEWDACMNVNVKGMWQCCKAAVPHMLERGGGSVINIASLAATYGLPYALHYTTSKAAVIGMTRGLARELGKAKVRVNAVAPSAVTTEGTRQFMGDKYDKALEVIASGQSIPENLDTDDLVGTVIYLASDASKFVTGQTISVDGGTVFL
ncbi:MAG: SDR family oxidoreductase [Minwuiales bacterium]|nr:SDR family oxidoreductase [Minwuiales bacterium]